jgi:hypothetical protein
MTETPVVATTSAKTLAMIERSSTPISSASKRPSVPTSSRMSAFGSVARSV